jgi:hypothetical protein
LLSMLSPVLHKMVCGCFKESASGRVELDDVEQMAFQEVVDLSCGKDGLEVKDLTHVMLLESIADRFQMTEVETELEDAILRNLSVNVCADMLLASADRGLERVEEAAYKMALERFEQVAATDGFIRIEEDVLSDLLDEDELVATSEEHVFECVLRWMKSGQSGLRGRKLLSKIRFPLMEPKYLALKVYEIFPEDHFDWIEGLMSEASRVKLIPAAERAAVKLRLLEPKALIPRICRGVRWEQCRIGGERRLDGHSNAVTSLAECQGMVCSGSEDGSIRVWDKDTLTCARTLEVDGGGALCALKEWEGRLISGHGDGRVRVWDVLTGRCERALEGHTNMVFQLATHGVHLLSGSADETIKVWCMGAQGTWPCERTLEGHTESIFSLTAWQHKVISGSADNTIRVWDLGSGQLEATLTEHSDTVTALVVHMNRLYSSSLDHSIRLWRAGTWELLRTVEAYGGDSSQFAYRLAVSGSRLVSGSADASDDEDRGIHYEIRVWDLDSLRCVHVLPQASGSQLFSLLPVAGEVWCGVGSKVVVVGRDD